MGNLFAGCGGYLTIKGGSGIGSFLYFSVFDDCNAAWIICSGRLIEMDGCIVCTCHHVFESNSIGFWLCVMYSPMI